MTFTENTKIILIWFIAGLIACFISLGWLTGSYVDGQFIPMGADSFYHAQRILVAVGGVDNFYQFDSRMHVPEGSIITWPWFYDLFLALIVKLVLLFVDVKPISILVFIPPLWVFVNTAFVIGIAGRMNIGLYLRLICGLCFAFSPLTLALHGVGEIDHHFAELTIVLATLYCGIGWLKEPENNIQAALFGLALGMGYGIHNGLFILQLPFLITLSLFWFTGKAPPNLNIKAFFISFALVSIVLIAPSLAFREGLFEFFTLSWFHLYISFCTLVFIYLIHRYPFSKKTGIFVSLICVFLVLPLVKEVYAGLTFISSEIEGYDRITETVSIVSMLYSPAWSFLRMSSMYSFLLWTVPFVIYFSVKNLSKYSTYSIFEMYFWVYCLFGLLFLLQQYRFHYFGSFALYIPLIYLFQQWSNDKQSQVRKYSAPLLTIFVVIVYLPTPTILFAKQPPALDADHHFYRPLFKELATHCEQNPGVVLADAFDGHYITFYTGCSVIANNFLINKLHITKYQQVNKLLSLNVSELLKENGDIDYIFVRVFRRDQASGSFHQNDIRRELLITEGSSNPRLKLIAESPYNASIGKTQVNVGRIYRVLRDK